MIHHKKILPEYFDAIQSGKKTYELRLGDFEVREGDTIVLQEWDIDNNTYTGRVIEKEITYVRTFDIDDLFWSRDDIEEHGLQILSIR